MQGEVGTALEVTKFDLKDRIQYECGCPEERCAISEIAIDKVTDKSGTSVSYKTLFSMTKEGTFEILD